MLTKLGFELSNLTAESDRAIQDHLTLRDRTELLLTGDPAPISTSMAPIDLISGTANIYSPALPSR